MFVGKDLLAFLGIITTDCHKHRYKLSIFALLLEMQTAGYTQAEDNYNLIQSLETFKKGMGDSTYWIIIRLFLVSMALYLL